MASILPGHEYDIFISYRHNDNRSGWVTDFVNALQEELSATIKEPISIYFDRNSHDGLLENHNVDKSLEGKLKCLIFIPVISQTYCDTNSFAWQHEFCAFNKLVKEDEFGRDIKLNNGNVASRILPIKIHDLDAEDSAAIENEIGGVLRAIEFIFKSSGVNRPLRLLEEHPQDNLNKTFYRDQINKVANAIKDLIHAFKAPSIHPATLTVQSPSNDNTGNIRKWLSISAAAVLLISIGTYFFLPDWVSSKFTSEPSSKTIAVLYFDNMSGDPSQEYMSDGLTEEIITRLTTIDGLRVTSRTSVRPYKGQALNLKQIADELGVAIVLEGSVRKSGNQLRITAQLINAETDEHLWAENFDRELKDVFAVQTEIAQTIAEKFRIHLTPEQNLKVAQISTRNTDAYENYLKARHIAFNEYYFIGDSMAFERSKALYEQAISMDPKFALALAGLSDLYDSYRSLNLEKFSPAMDSTRHALSLLAYKLEPNSAFVNNVRIWMLANREKPLLDSAFYHARKAYELEPNDYYNAESLGALMFQYLGLYEDAILFYERANSLNPLEPGNRGTLGLCYLYTNQVEKADKELQAAYEISPVNRFVNDADIMAWLIDKGRIEDAQQMRNIRIKKDPSRQYGFINARILLELGRQEEAEKLYPNLKNNPEWLSRVNRSKEAIASIKNLLLQDRFINRDVYLYLKYNTAYKGLKDNSDFQSILEAQRVKHEELLRHYRPMVAGLLK